MKLRNQFKAVLWLATCSICFGGKTYNQSSHPRNEVAILTNASDSHVSIDVIDGVRKGVPTHGTYEFLPGRHALRLRLSYTAANKRWESGPIDLTFVAAAAAELKIAIEETTTYIDPSRDGESKGSVKIWVEDINTGQHMNVAP